MSVLALAKIWGENSASSSTIPSAVGSWSKMIKLGVSHQALRGSIPLAGGSMSVHVFAVWYNSLRGLIPDVAGSMTALLEFGVGYNSLSGPIPHVVSSMISLQQFSVIGNSLCGPIPDVVGSMVALDIFNAAFNSLSGPILYVVGSISLIRLALWKNSLRGPIQSSPTASSSSMGPPPVRAQIAKSKPKANRTREQVQTEI